MFIAIDIGNTHTVIGIFKKESIAEVLRLPSKSKSSKTEIIAKMKQLVEKSGFEIKDVTGIGISSVVPELIKTYSAAARKIFRQDPLIINSELNLGFKILYDNPEKLGADRICTAAAGYAKHGGPIVIIDLGTATTFDVIGVNGDFLGGVIAPGIKTSAAALHKRTAKLPKVELNLPAKIICTDTESSIQAGILWGSIDALTGIVNRIKKELYKTELKEAKVIATGGFSEFIAKQTVLIQYVEPSLVLDGIRLIYKRAAGGK
jgi:type III pantothenate kinase